MNNSAVVARIGISSMVVATRLTVREAHRSVQDRNAASPGVEHFIVFDDDFEVGEDYMTTGEEVAA
jgi:hypothetical protein